jgi:hypothetical protein
MDQNEIPPSPRHIEVPFGASKMISEPTVRLVQTVYLFCLKISTLQTDRNKLPVEPRKHGGPSGASKMISEPMVRLAQTMHLSCTNTNNVSKCTKMRFHMTHVT